MYFRWRVNMNIAQKNVTLHNGIEMPVIGFGTAGIVEGATSIIEDAINAGYRHFETAPFYRNEEAIAEAIHNSGKDRDAFFITNKIPPHIKTYDATIRMAKRSMKKLKTDYLDALIINNPVPFGQEDADFSQENLEVWRALETLYDEEVVGAIGVSNFTESDLKPIMTHGKIRPHINQVAVFIGHTLDAVRDYCNAHNIVVQAHSPLARARLLKEPLIIQEASKMGVSAAQLALRFVLDIGVMPIVKSSTPDHMKANLDLDFVISKETMVTLKNINKDVRDYKPPGATKKQL